jgi:hypothetical protein
MFSTIAQWQQSGMSQKSWCKQEKITYSSFHYWYRRFKRDAVQSNPAIQPNFVQLQVDGQLAGVPWCELILNHGQRVIFHQPVSATLLSTLLA